MIDTRPGTFSTGVDDGPCMSERLPALREDARVKPGAWRFQWSNRLRPCPPHTAQYFSWISGFASSSPEMPECTISP